MSKGFKVTFQPEGRSMYVLPGTTLIEAAGRAGIPINAPCGGAGVCGKCRIEIVDGAPTPTEVDTAHLSADELKQGFRLACQTKVRDDMVVQVPVEARFFQKKAGLTNHGRDVELEPVVRTVHVTLAAPSLEDQRADADRLLDEVRKTAPDAVLPLDLLRELPQTLRELDFRISSIIADDEVVDIRPADCANCCYGLAFDVGTTTVVGMLVDLAEGREKAIAARTNPQVRFGDDVVSRIQHAQKENGLQVLREAIVGCVNEVIGVLCREAAVREADIYEAVFVGNTTMNHLLLGLDPTYLAEMPYVPVLRSQVVCRAPDTGLNIHPRAHVHALPNIAGFVGADTVAVGLAADILKINEPTVALDIGTNGEILATANGRLIACSTAAGPAFEGARIRFGMRAAEGAIEKVVIDEDVRVNVMGNVPARGICGSSLIDTVAELLRAGVIESTGRLLGPEDLPEGVPPAVAARVEQDDDGTRFILAREEETQIEGPVFLTQRDVREVQLAKGAIAAGIMILLSELGLVADDLHGILLAGTFGNFIRRSNAKRIGLLPDIPSERIQFIGNAAGAGAKLALLSRTCREEAEEISVRTEYIELGARLDFQQEFAAAMMFPES